MTLLAPLLGMTSGPDAIVRETTDTRRWDTNATETAYSAGVVICNVGDENLF